MKTDSAHKSNRDTTGVLMPVYCLLPILFTSACTSTLQPSKTVSETVIESIFPTATQEQPWRLDSAWREGGLGGAVLRASAIEHVVRQVNENFVSVAIGTDAEATVGTIDQANATTSPDSALIARIDDDPLLLERAWRKYCHHQLDMTPEEHTLVAHTQIPHHILNHGCNPGSLKK